MQDESYQELKRDYLALAVTVVDIVNGAAYLFEKETPKNRGGLESRIGIRAVPPCTWSGQGKKR